MSVIHISNGVAHRGLIKKDSFEEMTNKTLDKIYDVLKNYNERLLKLEERENNYVK